MTKRYEVNFDGLVGPTHFYGGLAPGNLASAEHRYQHSNPKKAALQGLEKMKLLMDLGVKQAVIPPQSRPLYSVLKRLGFDEHNNGSLAQLLDKKPDIVSSCFSASSMWVANIGTITSSSDSHDGKIHITPANLMSNFHRSLEVVYSKSLLEKIFPNAVHHPPNLTSIPDEGAANVMRLCGEGYGSAIHIFVHSKSIFDKKNETKYYPCRQSKEAFELIADAHDLNHDDCFFIAQNPDAIDHGVFHNDVIAMSYQNILIFHEKAFKRSHETIEDLKEAYQKKCGYPLICVEIHESDILVGEAVKTYLFNSQIVKSPSKGLILIAPKECESHVQARSVIEKRILTQSPIQEVCYVDVSQSMHNGGGPACLRWRAILTEEELTGINSQVILTDSLYDQLTEWVWFYYEEDVTLERCIQRDFIEKNNEALNKLYRLLHIEI